VPTDSPACEWQFVRRRNSSDKRAIVAGRARRLEHFLPIRATAKQPAAAYCDPLTGIFAAVLVNPTQLGSKIDRCFGWQDVPPLFAL
jgi:hypothetical protein